MANLLDLLFQREIFPQEYYKHKIIDSLFHCGYRFKNARHLSYNRRITSMKLCPQQQFLLVCGNSRTVTIYRCRPELNKFLECSSENTYPHSSNSPISNCLWYPVDSGLIAISILNKIYLIETEKSEIFYTQTLENSLTGVVTSMDWNSFDTTLIAAGLAQSQVRLFDVRSMNALPTIQVEYDPLRMGSEVKHITCVRWSPCDEKGLFVANSSRNFFLYDIRNLRKPVAQCSPLPTMNGHPVGEVLLTPDRLHLVTSHCNQCAVQAWKFNPGSSVDFLTLLSTSRMALNSSKQTGYRIVPFVTCDRVYSPEVDNRSYSVLCNDIQSGILDRQRSIPSPTISGFKARQVIGYGSDLFDDDPNAILIYADKFTVRWSSLAKTTSSVLSETSSPVFHSADSWSD